MLVCKCCGGIHLVPMGRECNWEKKKGSKDIKVTGMGDKRQVTCCVSSAATGVLLPMQIIFTENNNVFTQNSCYKDLFRLWIQLAYECQSLLKPKNISRARALNSCSVF